ncbi:amine dehydrogenase large subunit [Inquilinus sp. Marseille-Q2685]|uniref:amine dehydrogenase large subunit n=1 Tax=Inquilinus sp. Marseille-Q2685 TaxID=2866581 RepID=UPI001CE451D3|nr:amine dehydrogenase large subunit [Inquilinus sp. Marseille-Q2685]
MATPIRLVLVAASALLAPAAVAAEFTPEVVTAKAAIDPGPNVFVYQQEWKGAGSIAVFGQGDLAFKGLMTSGSMGQMLVAPDGKTVYGQSSYLKRITHGPNEQVVEIYDVPKLSLTKEIALPAKAAMALGYAPLLQRTATGRFLLVQNATPATSVTVVDLTAGSVTEEIPTPGCYGIYPSAQGDRFATACGDGTFQDIAIGPDGKAGEKAKSAALFDADADPVFIAPAAYDGGRVFVTYGGKALLLKDDGGPMKAAGSFDLTAGVTGGWAPGGYGIAAAAGNILFVTMHPDAKDGSHKAAAHEIWAYDLKAGKLLSRSPVEHVVSIAASGGDVPVLFGTTETGSLLRFTTDPAAGYALKAAGEAKVTGFPMSLAVAE